MEKAEAKALMNAIVSLTKTQQEQNKILDKLTRALTDTTDVNKEIRTRLLTVSTSIDNLANKNTTNS